MDLNPEYKLIPAKRFRHDQPLPASRKSVGFPCPYAFGWYFSEPTERPSFLYFDRNLCV